MIQMDRMRHRIEILRPVYGADTGFGAARGYESEGETWAEFLRPRFTQSDAMGSSVATEITQGIRIRPRRIEKGWKVRHKECEYYVLHVDASEPSELILTTKEVEAGG